MLHYQILAEQPERGDNPKELLEEVSGTKLGYTVKVYLHHCDNTNYYLTLLPSLDDINAISEKNEALASLFKSLTILNDPYV